MLRRQHAPPPALPEAMLPPELLARSLLPDLGGAPTATSASDVWHVGTFLYELHVGRPPQPFAASLVAHCAALDVPLAAAAPQMLAVVLRQLPPHHAPTSGGGGGAAAAAAAAAAAGVLPARGDEIADAILDG
eukprot:1693426-Prymnesium_polylepis.1